MILIAEFASYADALDTDGHGIQTREQSYELVAEVSTEGEAREFAAADMASRLKRVEAGEEVAHPEAYVLWGRNGNGDYVRVAEVLP